jgi:hypothetical protein
MVDERIYTEGMEPTKGRRKMRWIVDISWKTFDANRQNLEADSSTTTIKQT